MRATLSVCFFRASSTMRSTVELLRIRPTSPPILSTLRTFDHKITSNITSKTMPRAALIVATRFEIRDISAIPTNVHAHLYVSKRIQRFLALFENVVTNIYIYREIDSASILSRTLLAHQFIILWESHHPTWENYRTRKRIFPGIREPRLYPISSYIHKTLRREVSRSLFLLSNLVFLANDVLSTECN